MEVIQEHWDLDAGHAGPRVMLDTHLETWIGLKCYLDGIEMRFSWPSWSRGVLWMKMGRKCRDLDWGDTRPGWRLDVNLWAQMEMRWGVDGDETHISNWIWVRWNLDRCEPRYESLWEKNFWTLDGGDAIPGWRSDKNSGTWMKVRQHLGWGEMQISRAGLGWDVNWRDVIR